MPAPTTQQIKQQQQNSPEWQNKQTEEMYRQKWQGIFNNIQLCTRYVKGNNVLPTIAGTGSDATIQIPEDDTERKVAQEVAQTVVQNTPKVAVLPGQKLPDSEVIHAAAKKFLRACIVYTKKRTKGDTKEVNKFQKENPGVGTYGQGQLIPMSDNVVDMFNAGVNAGKQAAQYYMTSDQTSQDNLAQQIKKFMQNKCYNTCFWYTFYNTIKPHSNDELVTKQTRLNYLTPIYKQYEQQANPKTATEYARDSNARQVYENQARYGGKK